MASIVRWLSAPFRLVPWPLWVMLVGAGAWFGRSWLLIAATIVAFHPIPIPPLFQGEPATVEEAQLQDLQHFTHVRRNERSWTPESRERFDTLVAGLRERAGQMSEAEFMLGLARAQAAIDNGHSNASATAMVRRFPHLPIRTAFFGDELRVLRATPEHQDLLGARVTHVGDLSVAEVSQRFRGAFGGTDSSFRTIAPLILETPAYLNTIGVAGSNVSLRFEAADATAIERTLAAADAQGIETWTIPGDLPLFWRRDSETLRSFTPSGQPLYLRRPERGYWRADLPSLDATYINIRTNMDDESGQSLRDFSAETVAALRERAPQAVIVDLRFNHGGDYTLTHALMSALGEIVGEHGRVYLLTSGNTFSAAIVSLAFAKEAAPSQTLIVGEEIGDRLQFWAEGWGYSLPHSGFRARYATAFYDLQHGCTGLFRCYWGAFHLFPVIVSDLDVDIPAPLTFEAYAAGRDPALEAIQALEASRRETR